MNVVYPTHSTPHMVATSPTLGEKGNVNYSAHPTPHMMANFLMPGRELMAPRTDRTTRIPSGYSTHSTPHMVANSFTPIKYDSLATFGRKVNVDYSAFFTPHMVVNSFMPIRPCLGSHVAA